MAKFHSRESVLAQSTHAIGTMLSTIQELPSLRVADLPGERTALVVVDMVKGFVCEGSLQSNRIAALIPEIKNVMVKCRERNIPILAFADTHPEDSPEFAAYPPHCLKGTSESEIVEDLAGLAQTVIPKASTNGFLEEEFQQWLEDNPQIDTFVVVGDCTDICILQFVLTLKADFNRRHAASRVIVPVNAVDTFDADFHNGDLLNAVSLYIMWSGGVEVIGNLS